MTSSSSGDVIRLVEDALPRQRPVKVAPAEKEVTVTLDEVRVVNSSCVQLYWQLIGQRAAVRGLRVQYWPVVSSTPDSPRSSATLPVSTQFVLGGLQADTRYGLCVQAVYMSGALGRCSNTRHAYVTSPRNGMDQSISQSVYSFKKTFKNRTKRSTGH